jgi:hypothetical protein
MVALTATLKNDENNEIRISYDGENLIIGDRYDSVYINAAHAAKFVCAASTLLDSFALMKERVESKR